MKPNSLRFVAVFTAVHAVLTILSLLAICAVVTPGFGIGARPPVSSMAVIAFSFLLRLPLHLPLYWSHPDAFPGLWGYLPIFANSLIWASAAAALGGFLAGRRPMAKS